MKATLQTYLRSGDFQRLATSLSALANKQPAGNAGWAELARTGEVAVKAEDRAGVKASCRGGHEQFRKRFRARLSQLPLSRDAAGSLLFWGLIRRSRGVPAHRRARVRKAVSWNGAP